VWPETAEPARPSPLSAGLAMEAGGVVSDVYLYGMISPSSVYVLRKDFSFPRANTYAEIAETHLSIGGEAANSAIILAKLGLRTKLDGNWIHPRDAAQVKGLLSRFDIDLSRLSVRDDGGTQEVVIVDQRSRTVFGNYAAFHAGPRQWNDPQADDIRSADIVAIDPYFREQSRCAAELCVEHGKPYVTVDCRHDDYIAQNAASVVVSHELRDQAYPGSDMREVFRQYQEFCHGLTIFTFGSDELWWARPAGAIRTGRPYAIEPIDTTGAGDSFRAGIVYGIHRSWDDQKTIELASAVAACVCLSVPHTLNAPGLDGVLAFMDEHRAGRGGDGGGGRAGGHEEAGPRSR
jgi:sugar/nucleoside kinase (ribokinase family)